MNTWQPLQVTDEPQIVSGRALLGWALIVALALASCLVQVVNVQGQRGDAMWEQHHLVFGVLPPKQALPLKMARADTNHPVRHGADTR